MTLLHPDAIARKLGALKSILFDVIRVTATTPVEAARPLEDVLRRTIQLIRNAFEGSFFGVPVANERVERLLALIRPLVPRLPRLNYLSALRGILIVLRFPCVLLVSGPTWRKTGILIFSHDGDAINVL